MIQYRMISRKVRCGRTHATPFTPPAPVKLQPGLPQPLLEVWRTKDGREIPIAAMKDDHLLNTIIFMRRKAPEIKVLTRTVTTEALCVRLNHHPELQGEAAMEALEAETYKIDRTISYEESLAVYRPQYRALVAEAVRRDLTVPPFDEAAAEQEGRVLAMRYLLQKRGF